MSAKIKFLINKNDNFEIIRDEIAAIILTEQADQKILAASSPVVTPEYFNFDLYVERQSPVDVLINDTGEIKSDANPIVNVWFNQSNMIQERSIQHGLQTYKSEFYIDVYSTKETAIDNNDNVVRGDALASKDVQRIIKIIRNILANHNYVNFNLPYVTRKQILSWQMFQPNNTENTALNIAGGRIILSIEHFETTDENAWESLETLQSKIVISEDGQVFFDMDFDYT